MKQDRATIQRPKKSTPLPKKTAAIMKQDRKAIPAPKTTASPRWPVREFAVFALLWVPYALLVRRFWFVCEDAFISFRYARNWAAGLGLRYNLGNEPPVEGYTNFLWMAICAVIELFGGDIELWPALIDFACGSVLLYLIFRALRVSCGLNLPVAALATLCLGCFPPYALWSSSGLETMPLALVVFLTFERLILRQPSAAPVAAGLAGLATALMRADGIAWAVLIGLLALLSELLGGRRGRRSIALYFAIVGVGFTIYYACRYAYFGEWLPNTAYAKMGLSEPFLLRSARCLLTFFVAFLTPLMLFPGAVAAWRVAPRAKSVPVILMVLVSLAYCFLAGGDWMPMGRLLIHGLVVFNAILLGWLLQGLWDRRGRGPAMALTTAAVVIGLGLLPAFDKHVAPLSVRNKLHFRHNVTFYRSEYEQWFVMERNADKYRAIGKTLKTNTNHGDSIVMMPIGYIGYYSDLYIYDQNGLVTPEVARHPAGDELKSPGHDKQVDYTFFLKDRPTWILPRFLPVTPDKLLTLSKQTYEMPIARIYVPAFFRLVEPFKTEAAEYVFVLRRIEEGEDELELWKASQARLRNIIFAEARQRKQGKPAPEDG